MWPFDSYNAKDERIAELNRKNKNLICDIELLKDKLNTNGNRIEQMACDLKKLIDEYGERYGIKSGFYQRYSYMGYVGGVGRDWNSQNQWGHVVCVAKSLLDYYEELLEDKRKEIDRKIDPDRFNNVNDALKSANNEIRGLEKKLREKIKENTMMKDTIDTITQTKGREHFLDKLKTAEENVKKLEEKNKCLKMALKEVGG